VAGSARRRGRRSPTRRPSPLLVPHTSGWTLRGGRRGAIYSEGVSLHQAIHETLGQAMATARQLVADQPQLVMHAVVKPRAAPEGGWQLPQSIELDPAMLAAVAAREMLGTPPFEGFVSAVQQDASLASALPGEEQDPAWWINVTLLQPFIRRLVDLGGWETDQAEPSAIDQVLEELLTYHRAEAVPFWVRCSAFNLQGELDQLQIADGLRLKRLSAEEKGELVGRATGGPSGLTRGLSSVADALSWEYLLERRVDWMKGTVSPLDHETSGLGRALTALRLLRPGRVRPGVTWLEPAEPWAHFAEPNSGFGGTLGSARPVLLGPMLQLGQGDGPELARLHDQLSLVTSDPVLAFALRRLEAAGERMAPEDQLVDYWIALEALFGQSSVKGEVLYRLALRMARFLEGDLKAREHLRGKVLAYYGVRSRVVHGDPGVDAAEAEKVRDRTEDLLRRALRRWIDPEVDNDMTALELG
jgi:hypothetical protein